MSVPPLRGGPAREAELLGAVFNVLRESGYDGLTVDAVAALARASKQTVYRRWPTKVDLVIAAFLDAVSMMPSPAEDTGRLRSDLLSMFGSLHREMVELGDVIAGLVGEQRRNAKLAAAMRSGYVDARARSLRDVFVRARARGELGEDVDLDLLCELGPAVIFFRALLSPEPADSDLPRRIVDDLVMPLVRRV